MAKKLYLIDASSHFYRAFYAIPVLSNSRGMPTNAIFGFTNMLLKIVRDCKPDYLAIVFDSKEPSVRKNRYAHYKANRPTMPHDLQIQIPYIKNLVQGFNIAAFEKDGIEADDIIGTICKKCKKDLDVIIVSGDKDMMQLIEPTVMMVDTMKNKTYGPQDVVEKFGIKPSMVVDFLGLMGDSSDNIPGVPGVGPKTAQKLLETYGSIEGIYKHIDEIEKAALKENLLTYKEDALLSKELATIDQNIQIDFDLEQMGYNADKWNSDYLRTLFSELEFNKLAQEVSSEKTIDMSNYKTLYSLDEIKKVVEKIKKYKLVSIDFETTSPLPTRAEIVGIAISLQDKECESYYIPVAHTKSEISQPDRDEVLVLFKDIAESTEIKKIGQNLKYEYIVFSRYGITLRGILFDSMIASYVIHPSGYRHKLDYIVLDILKHKMISYEDVTGKGVKQINFRDVAVDVATTYACEDAHVVCLLYEPLHEVMKKNKLLDLYNDIEIPLISVLARMEIAGIKVDQTILEKFSTEFEKRLKSLEEEIFKLAGCEFNINSPKQLADVLFDTLKLTSKKKTKTGRSTDNRVLQDLQDVHPIITHILEHRSLSKLKGTYTDALQDLIYEKTGRIHTSFNQTVAATGRLSSSDPNLQNIPIKSEDGAKIREAFVAERGHMLISADYSQIELRLLAHLSQDPTLLQSFKEDFDIHTKTAMELFEIKKDEVTIEKRRIAKTINFGIIYGMGATKLAQELHIKRAEAMKYIKSYFAKYTSIKKYTEEVIEKARENGYVETLFKRKRYIPDISSQDPMLRSFAERVAVNTPIQGTAADLIKIAMIRIDEIIQKQKLTSKMILQVHDELVFEVPNNEVEMIKAMIKNEMENVTHLDVPLKVEIGGGKNWMEAH